MAPAAATMSFCVSIARPDSTSASGILGVSTLAIGSRHSFNVSIASSLISLDPLVATMTGSTTILSALYAFNFSAMMRIRGLADTIPILTASG